MILNHIAGQCPVNNKAIAMTHINSYIKRGVQRKKLYALIFFYIKKNDDDVHDTHNLSPLFMAN